MADLETRFRRLDRVRGPDLWPDIETRQPKPMSESGMGRRFAATAVALAVAAGGAVLVVRAFVGERPAERPVQPAESPPEPVDPVVDVTLPIRWPSSIVYGEGSIWVAASANDGTPGGTIYRIDPSTAEILAEIPSPVVPGWVTGGGAMEVANGDLWVGGGGASRGVVRIDVSTNQIVQEIPVEGGFIGDLAIDEHGLWVSVFGRDDDGQRIYLVRLDRTTGVEEARFEMESEYAREVLAVDGTIWLHEKETHGSVVGNSVLTRIDPETGQILASVPVGSHASSVAHDDAFIWVPTGTSDDGNQLLRVDPQTNEDVTFPSENLEFVIEVGEGGIWGVARRGQDLFGERSGIVRFDPVTGRVDAAVGIPGGTIALAVAPDSVWVVSYEEGVTRVELRPA